ncbi:proton pump-interactor 1-like [Trifolium pratense]|uniref:proton pump-interactor 1-like n=1 Tax=Trifolium pratense TaxID=57577 RepID=UPI001E69183B|nr:proton pump-interactor 1-like [Trifolium pratense]
MENKKTTSPSKPIDENSKLVHQFYFVKIWPTDPDSISKIKKEENLVKKMNHEIAEITETIAKKMAERDHLASVLQRLNYPQKDRRNRVASKEKIVRDLHMILDELSLLNKKSAKGRWFNEELDKDSLNSLVLQLHGSKSLVEEKKILRNINIQQKDDDSFKSLEVLKKKIRWSYYLKNWQKLLREIEQFQIQCLERVSGNNFEKRNISNYESLKKIIEVEIKVLCDDSLENRNEGLKCGIRIRHAAKELEAKNQELYSLKEILSEKNKKKVEAYQRILELKKLYNEEILHYYHYCSLINKVHQLVEGKDVATLDEMSSSEVGKFMLEWKNNKAFREDYERKVLRSLERRQLSRDGRRRPDKSANSNMNNHIKWCIMNKFVISL